MEKTRVIFPKGSQQKFVKICKGKSNLTWKELAKKLDINPSTLKRSIQYEICSLPNSVFLKMCKMIGSDPDKVVKSCNAQRIEHRPNLHFPDNFGRRKNILPSELFLRNRPKLVHFDLSPINRSRVDMIKRIKLPLQLSPLLAEEIGIHIGDGHLSEKRNRFKLFGNQDESDYYNNFIKNLYKNLFNLEIRMRRRKDNIIGFEAYSRALWLFKTNIIGLPYGRKNKIAVPKLILNSSIDCLKSFLRGIFDTDGNLYFQSRYGYKNYYPRLEISAKSYLLCTDIQKILEMLTFKAAINKGKDVYCVVMYGYENIIKYASEIGWHNKKHRLKFKKWCQKYPQLSGRAGVVG